MCLLVPSVSWCHRNVVESGFNSRVTFIRFGWKNIGSNQKCHLLVVGASTDTDLINSHHHDFVSRPLIKPKSHDREWNDPKKWRHLFLDWTLHCNRQTHFYLITLKKRDFSFPVWFGSRDSPILSFCVGVTDGRRGRFQDVSDRLLAALMLK